MNTSFTPGPWKVNDINPDAVHAVNGGQRVALCKPTGCVCHTEQDRANARLIAAAPSLLEALTECYKSLLSHYTDGHVYTLDAKRLDDALAAINLATGQ